MTLQGAGRDTTIISSGSLDVGAQDTGLGRPNINVTLSGIRVQGADSGGISNEFATLMVADSILTGNRRGLTNNMGRLTVIRTLIENNGRVTDGPSEGAGIYSRGELTVIDSIIRDNTLYQTGRVLNGGGIYKTDPGDLFISGSTIVGNGGASVQGGGLYIIHGFNPAVSRIVNSTFNGNLATDGGGLFVASGIPDTILNNVTLMGNRAVNGGGIYVFRNDQYQRPVTLENSIVWGNIMQITGNPPDDLAGEIVSRGHNLIGVLTGATLSGDLTGNLIGLDPLLGPLGDNGGYTPTFALLAGSPAINAANNATCEVTDQRGVLRPQGTACDIGAFESTGLPPDRVPPLVTQTDSFRDSGDGILLENENTGVDVTRLMISFNEVVNNPAGDTDPNDVSNPVNYRLFTAGANGSVDTAACGLTVGDDLTIGIDQVVYDEATQTTTLYLNGGTRLTSAVYRLIVCDALRDLDGNALDGDVNGSAGGHFIRNFTIDLAQTGPTLNVNTASDVNDGSCTEAHCSLREALIRANSLAGELITINVPAGNYLLTIPGRGENHALTGDLDIERRVNLVGAGAATTIIDGGGLDRVFHIGVPGDITISGMTIRNGDADDTGIGSGILGGAPLILIRTTVENNQARYGGGIYVSNLQQTALQMTDSTVRNNTATFADGTEFGGGIYLWGDAEITRSTISGNTSDGEGGGLFIHETGAVWITNSTISGNVAQGNGGGMAAVTMEIGHIYVNMRNVTITNNTTVTGDGGGLYDFHRFDPNHVGFQTSNGIIAGNFDTGGATSFPNIYPRVVSGVNNLYGDVTGVPIDGTSDFKGVEARLGPLQDNGGPTWTHLPMPDSLAIDNGFDSQCATVDQRGITRPQGRACDIGAVETTGPGQVTLLTPADQTIVNAANVTLSWNAVSGAVSYTVQTDNDSTFGSPDRAEQVSGTTLALTGLNDGQHFWRVQAINSSNEPGAWSPSVLSLSIPRGQPRRPFPVQPIWQPSPSFNPNSSGTGQQTQSAIICNWRTMSVSTTRWRM